MGHTPGPWKIVTPSWQGHYEVLQAIETEHSANKKLIEAAPKLLAALKNLVDLCGQLADCGYVHKDSLKPIEWSPDGYLVQAQDAIKEAVEQP